MLISLRSVFTSTFCVIWASSIVMDKGPIPGVTFTTSVYFSKSGAVSSSLYSPASSGISKSPAAAVVPSLTTLSP